jgi:hypothetical protein
MDFNNVTDLLNGMKDYFDSHDIRKADIFQYEELKLSRKPDPRIQELIDKDKYGEYIGRCARGWINSDSSGPKVNDITFYLRPDGRIAGVWNTINRMIDTYEIFDYHDGYYTGAMYSLMGRMEHHMNFVYYIVNGDGKVIEMFSINGGVIALNSEYVTVTETVIDYEGDETVLKSSRDYKFKKSGEDYELMREFDNTVTHSPEKRVFDNQHGLCRELKKAVKECGTLEEVVNAFFDVIKTAKENPEEEVTYTAGTSPYKELGLPSGPLFTLMRWTPSEDDEYYQLQLNVDFDIKNEKIPYDNKNDVEGVDALRESVLNSDSFKALKDKKIKKIKVEVVET